MTALGELGLPATARVRDVDEWWRKRRSHLHPDHGGNADEFFRLGRLVDRARLEAEVNERCPGCHGTGRIRLTGGFSQIHMTCAGCGGDGRRQD